MNNDIDLVKVLIQAGANVYKKTEDGRSAFLWGTFDNIIILIFGLNKIIFKYNFKRFTWAILTSLNTYYKLVQM